MRGLHIQHAYDVYLAVPGQSLLLCPLQMQHAYDDYNDRVRATGKSRGHFMVDLCRPGHLTACLRNFQEATGCSDENWESQFGV